MPGPPHHYGDQGDHNGGDAYRGGDDRGDDGGGGDNGAGTSRSPAKAPQAYAGSPVDTFRMIVGMFLGSSSESALGYCSMTVPSP